MFISYALRGLISSLALYGLSNRLRLISLKETGIHTVLGTLAYGVFGGYGYLFYLTGSILVTLGLKLPAILHTRATQK